MRVEFSIERFRVLVDRCRASPSLEEQRELCEFMYAHADKLLDAMEENARFKMQLARISTAAERSVRQADTQLALSKELADEAMASKRLDGETHVCEPESSGPRAPESKDTK